MGQRVLKQSLAFGALKLASSIVTLVAGIALYRILGTRDYGAFGIGMMYVAFGQLIGDGGLAAALIRRKDDELEPIEFKTAFTTVFCIGATFALTFFVLTPWVAEINQLREDEADVLRILAVLFVLPSLWMVPYVRLERDLNYAAIGRIELIANFVKHVLAVVVAAAGGGIYALVVAQLAFMLIRIVFAYRLVPGWYGFGWAWAPFRELITFGSKMQAVSFFIELKNRLAAGLIGPWLGPSAVGLFEFGLNYVKVPADLVGGIARVQFPAYARLDHDDPELASLVANAMRAGLLVSVPSLGGLVLASGWLVPNLYTDKWVPAFPVIWGLVPHIMADIAVMQLIVFAQGRGRAGLALVFYGLWSVALWGASALALTVWGDLGAVAVAHSLVTVVVLGGLLTWALSYLRHPVLPTVGPTLAAGLIAWLPGLAVVRLDAGSWRLAAAVAVFVGTFVVMLLVLDRARTLREFRAVYNRVRGRWSRGG